MCITLESNLSMHQPSEYYISLEIADPLETHGHSYLEVVTLKYSNYQWYAIF